MSGKPKIGEGALDAAGRLGLSELRNGLYPESNIAEKHSPYGVWGTLTPGEVAEARRSGERDLDGESPKSSAVNDRLSQASRNFDAPEMEPPDIDLDMDM